MRRILVPLDGSHLAAQILHDARRLAGSDGEVILVSDTGRADVFQQHEAVRTRHRYLETKVQELREHGVKARSEVLAIGDPAVTVDTAARLYDVDMIACATHGRGPLGRLRHGSVAWKAVANSPAPILLRHVDETLWPPDWTEYVPLSQRRILVPLDGSPLAESALSVARELAAEWQAGLWLVHVVNQMFPIIEVPLVSLELRAHRESVDAQREMHAYLQHIARDLKGEVHISFVLGDPNRALVEATDNWSITDVVMTSHGRTGLSRVILGSVADALVQHLQLPILIIPALVTESALSKPDRERTRVSA